MVCDLDGTLLTKDGKISDANRKAIEGVREKGVPFVIGTGRIFSAAVPYALDLGLKAPLIACNGALIKSLETGENIYIQPMEINSVKVVIDILRKYKQPFHFYDEDTIYAEVDSPLFRFAQKMAKEHNLEGLKTQMVDDVKSIVGNPVQVLKMGFHATGDEVEKEVIEAICQIPRLDIVQSASQLKDVMRIDVSKGDAVIHLAKIMGIDRSEILALGDNHNDIEMLKVAGVGVAMDNACDTVKAISDDVATHHEEDGVAWALEKYILNA